MKKTSVLLSIAAGLVLLAAGCETTGGIPGRKKEKAAVYGAMQQWEKRYVDRGLVAVGFTPDMVYMAVGRPSKVEPQENKAELWSYKRFFPTPDANYPPFGTTDPAPMSAPAMKMAATQENVANAKGPRAVAGSPAINRPDGFSTGGPQGAAMEPADMQAYTLYLLFEDGKVTKLGINPE